MLLQPGRPGKNRMVRGRRGQVLCWKPRKRPPGRDPRTGLSCCTVTALGLLPPLYRPCSFPDMESLPSVSAMVVGGEEAWWSELELGEVEREAAMSPGGSRSSSSSSWSCRLGARRCRGGACGRETRELQSASTTSIHTLSPWMESLFHRTTYLAWFPGTQLT